MGASELLIVGQQGSEGGQGSNSFFFIGGGNQWKEGMPISFLMT